MLYEKDEDKKYDEIVELCIDYQIPAKGYAAFVAVFENEEEHVTKESMKVQNVENMSGASEVFISEEVEEGRKGKRHPNLV